MPCSANEPVIIPLFSTASFGLEGENEIDDTVSVREIAGERQFTFDDFILILSRRRFVVTERLVVHEFGHSAQLRFT